MFSLSRHDVPTSHRRSTVTFPGTGNNRATYSRSKRNLLSLCSACITPTSVTGDPVCKSVEFGSRYCDLSAEHTKTPLEWLITCWESRRNLLSPGDSGADYLRRWRRCRLIVVSRRKGTSNATDSSVSSTRNPPSWRSAEHDICYLAWTGYLTDAGTEWTELKADDICYTLSICEFISTADETSPRSAPSKANETSSLASDGGDSLWFRRG